MIDGFLLTLLLGECFEVLHTIIAVSSDNNPHQSLDHISQLMVSAQTADWVSNQSRENKRRASADYGQARHSEFSTIFHTLSDDENKLIKCSRILGFIHDILQ